MLPEQEWVTECLWLFRRCRRPVCGTLCMKPRSFWKMISFACTVTRQSQWQNLQTKLESIVYNVLGIILEQISSIKQISFWNHVNTNQWILHKMTIKALTCLRRFSLSSDRLIVSKDSRSVAEAALPIRTSLRSLKCFSSDFCWASKQAFKSLLVKPKLTGFEAGFSCWADWTDLAASDSEEDIWLISVTLSFISVLTLAKSWKETLFKLSA